MKAMVAFLLMFMVVMVATVQAKEFEWQDPQVLIPIGGEVPIIEDKFSFRSSISYFRIPSAEVEQFYSYMGPKWTVKKWNKNDSFWLAPQIGVVSGDKMDYGKAALILSLWSRAVFLNGSVAVFAEAEGYLNPSQQAYYGYYCADYIFAGTVNVGVHAEQVDKTVSIGPHIGITHGSWRSELSYLAGFQESNYGHAIRMTTGSSF